MSFALLGVGMGGRPWLLVPALHWPSISGEFTSSVTAWTFPCPKEERRCQGLAFTQQLIPRETCPRQEGIGPELPHPTARRAAPSLRPQLACSHLLGSCFKRQSQMVRSKIVNESV